MLLGVDVEDELNKLIEDQLAHYSAAGIKKPPPLPYTYALSRSKFVGGAQVILEKLWAPFLVMV